MLVHTHVSIATLMWVSLAALGSARDVAGQNPLVSLTTGDVLSAESGIGSSSPARKTFPAKSTFQTLRLSAQRTPYEEAEYVGKARFGGISIHNEIAGSSGGANGAVGPNRVIAKFAFPTPIQVRLQFLASTSSATPFTSHETRIWVDIGRTGTKDMVFNTTKVQDSMALQTPVFTLDQAGLEVEFSTLLKGSIPARANTLNKLANSLEIRLLPVCDGKTRGATRCGGSPFVSTGLDLRGTLYVFQVGNTVGQAGFIGFGTTALNLPLPGSSCRLLTDVPILVPFVAKGQRTQHAFPVPRITGPATYHVQVFYVTSSSILSSQATDIICK